MSAMKLHIHLASCRIIRRLSNHPAFRVHSSSSPAHFVKQHRRPFSSTRNASNTSPGPKPGLNILTALPAFCLLGFAYKHLSPEFNHPQALDVPDPIEGFDGRTVKYEPFLRPPTAEEVNENLRWEESSRCLGPPTGVLRYDAVRIPSNQPCEDYLITVFGSQGDPNVIGENLKWFVWGVFDGHA